MTTKTRCRHTLSPTSRKGCGLYPVHCSRNAVLGGYCKQHAKIHGVREPIVQAYDESCGLYAMPTCIYCTGQGRLLGTLGNTTHYRCENCGLDFSVTQ